MTIFKKIQIKYHFLFYFSSVVHIVTLKRLYENFFVLMNKSNSNSKYFFSTCKALDNQKNRFQVKNGQILFSLIEVLSENTKQTHRDKIA